MQVIQLDLGAVLQQNNQAVAYASRTLNRQQPSQQEPSESISEDPTTTSISTKVVHTLRCLGFDCNDDTFGIQKSLVQCVPELSTIVPPGSDPPSIRSSTNKSWTKNYTALNYTALSFLMNSQLFVEYERVTNMLGISSCSRIVEWTEKHVHE